MTDRSAVTIELGRSRHGGSSPPDHDAGPWSVIRNPREVRA
jgi:hypothetical protein